MLREKSGLSLLYTHRIRLLRIELYEIYNCIGPGYLQNILAKPDGIIITRNNFATHLLYVILRFKLSIRCDGAKRWNNLDIYMHVKGCVTLDAFKHAIFKLNAPHCTCSYCKVCILTRM